MLFGSLFLFSKTYELDLHNETCVALANQWSANIKVITKFGLNFGPIMIYLWLFGVHAC